MTHLVAHANTPGPTGGVPLSAHPVLLAVTLLCAAGWLLLGWVQLRRGRQRGVPHRHGATLTAAEWGCALVACFGVVQMTYDAMVV